VISNENESENEKQKGFSFMKVQSKDHRECVIAQTQVQQTGKSQKLLFREDKVVRGNGKTKSHKKINTIGWPIQNER
jgi:hypothetical protein